MSLVKRVEISLREFIVRRYQFQLQSGRTFPRVTGDGLRVAGDGWRVTGGGWRVAGRRVAGSGWRVVGL